MLVYLNGCVSSTKIKNMVEIETIPYSYTIPVLIQKVQLMLLSETYPTYKIFSLHIQ